MMQTCASAHICAYLYACGMPCRRKGAAELVVFDPIQANRKDRPPLCIRPTVVFNIVAMAPIAQVRHALECFGMWLAGVSVAAAGKIIANPPHAIRLIFLAP